MSELCHSYAGDDDDDDDADALPLLHRPTLLLKAHRQQQGPDFIFSSLLDPVKVKVEPSDKDDLFSHPMTASSASDAVSIAHKDWFDDLDNVPLTLRRNILLSSNRSLAINESNSGLYDNPSKMHHDFPTKGDEMHCDFPGIAKDFADYLVKIEAEENLPFSGDSRTENELHGSGEISNVAVSAELQASEGTSSVEWKISKLERSAPEDNVTSKPSIGKMEDGGHSPLHEDKLDHMVLRERMKLLTPYENYESDHLKKDCMSSGDIPASGNITSVMKFAKPISVRLPRKRRKTVTDSVGTALEEDAPGLLQVLVDNGVSVEELKLYGDVDEPLDDSTIEESFSELEEVITKLFSQRQPILKSALPKGIRDTKITYCFACLFSLVEQTRYLQFRKWPVEWGWCRELGSFIFVFERHNRIVLERPEYGYATYFFELVDSVPITWQIKRLVIVMKLTSCSRTSLIENRTLTIGEDLTEMEARVLMEYGWRSNSGLGTMLNYCDRVVHDRQKEIEDASDWRAKIGKLLMDGYHGGTLISSTTLKEMST